MKIFILALMFTSTVLAGNFLEIQKFGTNPGQLRMHFYRPDKVLLNSPLVVVLHGCNQSAIDFAENSGWMEMAERYKFTLLLPEQSSSNNFLKCFNWFESKDIVRGRGEVESIAQMTSYMKGKFKIDQDKVFVVGMSAGAGMTIAVLANYPDIFSAGASAAGIPYGCAYGLGDAYLCMGSISHKTPKEWANKVESIFGYSGKWPKLSIWQGMSDSVVNPRNAQELVKQWTALHKIDLIPSSTKEFMTHEYSSFGEGQKSGLVELYNIENMGHGYAVFPGNSKENCGASSSYILDMNICATYHISKFFGLR